MNLVYARVSVMQGTLDTVLWLEYIYSIKRLGISGGLVYLGKGWHDARETGHAVVVRGRLPVKHIGTSNHI